MTLLLNQVRCLHSGTSRSLRALPQVARHAFGEFFGLSSHDVHQQFQGYRPRENAFLTIRRTLVSTVST